MRCNRKIACFAVTPRKKIVKWLNVTEIWQLRRLKKARTEISDFRRKKIRFILREPKFTGD